METLNSNRLPHHGEFPYDVEMWPPRSISALSGASIPAAVVWSEEVVVRTQTATSVSVEVLNWDEGDKTVRSNIGARDSEDEHQNSYYR